MSTATKHPTASVKAAQRKLAKAREQVEQRNRELADACLAAIDEGASYATIGEELGMTRASAHAFVKRWASDGQG